MWQEVFRCLVMWYRLNFTDTIVSKLTQTHSHLDIDSPNNLVARDITETTVTVMWDKVRAEIDGYKLTYSSAEGFTQEIQVGADATSYQLTSLKPGVQYTIFIWAYKGSRLSKKNSTEAETGKQFISYFPCWFPTLREYLIVFILFFLLHLMFNSLQFPVWSCCFVVKLHYY